MDKQNNRHRSIPVASMGAAVVPYAELVNAESPYNDSSLSGKRFGALYWVDMEGPLEPNTFWPHIATGSLPADKWATLDGQEAIAPFYTLWKDVEALSSEAIAYGNSVGNRFPVQYLHPDQLRVEYMPGEDSNLLIPFTVKEASTVTLSLDSTKAINTVPYVLDEGFSSVAPGDLNGGINFSGVLPAGLYYFKVTYDVGGQNPPSETTTFSNLVGTAVPV